MLLLTELLKVKDEIKEESKGKGKGNNYLWKKEIMESKSVQEIGKLSDGKQYRKWLTKMKNLFDRSPPWWKANGRISRDDER